MRTLEQIQIEESCDLIAAKHIQERGSNRRLGIAAMGACLLIGFFIASAFWCPMYLRSMSRENSMLAYLASTGQSFTNGFRFVSNTWVNSSAKFALPIAPSNLVVKGSNPDSKLVLDALVFEIFRNGVLSGALAERARPGELNGIQIIEEAFRGSWAEKYLGTNQPPFVKVLP